MPEGIISLVEVEDTQAEANCDCVSCDYCDCFTGGSTCDGDYCQTEG